METIQPFSPRQHMIRRTFEIFHYRGGYPSGVALHHHDFYEVYLFLSGNLDYIIESRLYHVVPGDILLICPNQLHQPVFADRSTVYDRVVLWIDKAYLQRYTSFDAELTRCFDRAAAQHTNLIRPDGASLALLQGLLESALRESNSDEFASAMVSETLLVQAMVLINRMAEKGSQEPVNREKTDHVVGRVLGYINEHYNEELSLDELANRFFISKYHLSREFNRLVGTSVYRYIIQKRLASAKQMLSDGIPSTEVYQHCGFGDYSNFYRAFKAEYQMSPKEYTEQIKSATDHPAPVPFPTP